MTALINASTSSGVVVTSDTSGSLAFQSNGTTIMTVASTGVSTQVGAPAFSVYIGSNQSISSSATWTKIAFDTKVFDTNTNFNTSTNRFTPTVAGYYQINLTYFISGGTSAEVSSAIYKNGSPVNYLIDAAVSTMWASTGSVLVYMNGTTDYLEGYFYIATTGKSLSGSNTTMTGFLARSA